MPLPKKNAGDPLGARHVNALSAAADKVLSTRAGAYTQGNSGIAPFFQRKFIITEQGCDDTSDQDEDNETDYWTVYPRYFNASTSTWLTDSRGDGYCLDTLGLDQEFAVGDEVVAYWDPQRGALVPVSSTSSRPQLNSGTCGCVCIDQGDIVVSSYETSSVMVVALSELENEETHGRVLLPANEHELTYNVGLGYWYKDVSDELIAYYNSGNPYTLTGVTATIVFKHNDGDYMSLEIDWPDDLVPEE